MPRKRKNLYTKQFLTWQKNLGATQSVLLILVLFITALFAIKQVQIYREKTQYKGAEKHIAAYVEKISKLAPSSKEFTNYCRYNSAKFAKGPLGCFISGGVKYEALSDGRLNEIIKLIDSTQKPNGWLFVRDNTWNYSNLPKTEIKNTIYEFAQLSCGIRYSFVVDDSQQIITIGEKRLLRVTADCSGAAQKEYYPVVDY